MKDSEIISKILDVMSINETLSKSGDAYDIPEGITPQEVKEAIIERAIPFLNDELKMPYGKTRLGISISESQALVDEQICRFCSIVKNICEVLYIYCPSGETIKTALRENLDPKYV